MKYRRDLQKRIKRCRTPRGVRGLKSPWAVQRQTVASRTPRGVRGLKLIMNRAVICTYAGRTPRGVRGLKYLYAMRGQHQNASHPPRGAWVEIEGLHGWLFRRGVAPPAGCVG